MMFGEKQLNIKDIGDMITENMFEFENDMKVNFKLLKFNMTDILILLGTRNCMEYCYG